MPLYTYIINFAAASITVLLLFFYFRKSRLKWRELIRGSLDYHRYHVMMLLAKENNSREEGALRSMKWLIERQFPRDRSSNITGLRGFWISMRTGNTSINILGELFYQVSVYSRDMDGRILKLFSTLYGTVFRAYFLESILALPVLIYMDFMLLLSHIKKSKSGINALFLSIARDR